MNSEYSNKLWSDYHQPAAWLCTLSALSVFSWSSLGWAWRWLFSQGPLPWFMMKAKRALPAVNSLWETRFWLKKSLNALSVATQQDVAIVFKAESWRLASAWSIGSVLCSVTLVALHFRRYKCLTVWAQFESFLFLNSLRHQSMLEQSNLKASRPWVAQGLLISSRLAWSWMR